MIESIEYLSLDGALEFKPQVQTIAISILSPGRAQAALHPEIAPVLRLYFEDTTGKEGVIPPFLGAARSRVTRPWPTAALV